MKVWEKIKTGFPEEIDRWELEDHRGTHVWWPLAYMDEEQEPSSPVYITTRRNSDHDEDDED